MVSADDCLSLLPASGGWCNRCACVHALPAQPVLRDCLELMAQLRRLGRIDWLAEPEAADCRCSTDGLFGEAGGKMFGLLRCRNAVGERVTLRAFSGQFNGLWRVAGWVGPVFDVAAFDALVREPEREIKRLGREMGVFPQESTQWIALRRARKTLSRQLMRQIHDLYHLVNFRGEQTPLVKAFVGNGAPPSGTGDCCGPKLLHYAATHGLWPEAMAEFYWGRSSASGAKEHGRLYSACAGKCQPILGFQLCGLQ